MNRKYSTPLGLTSQFSFCGLPFRMDTYAGCALSCSYCFARLRGGNADTNKIRVANSDQIITKFKNANNKPNSNTSVISEFIRNKTPLHLGGMSDPFQPIEEKYETTYKVLEYLCKINYPIVISTKSTLIGKQKYLDLLKTNPNIVVQFSFSTTDDKTSLVVEPYSFKPSEILKTIDLLSKSKIKTTIRWQPYIPQVSESFDEFISRVSSVGARHLGFEHLKLPLEKNNILWKRLISNLDFNILEFYKSEGAISDGRELILPAKYKIKNALEVKSICHRNNLTFGSADNEIQYLSDNDCCCSGVDQFEGFENWNKFQISYAIKKSKGNLISFDLIEDEWFPKGAVDKHLNSKSRIQNNTMTHNSVKNYILDRWENLKSPFNPINFLDIEYNGLKDKNGIKIYEWSNR